MRTSQIHDHYEPERLKQIYDKAERGKARMDGIREAIVQADAHEDTPFRVYFRLQLCEESNFYGDSMDMLVTFPQVLAIVDRYPDTPCTRYNNRVFANCMGHVLWVYKWILNSCDEFYQIPMTDCENFFEDFKRRSLAYGYNLRPYYLCRYYFYNSMDLDEKARETFFAYESLPRDANCNCKACERNASIGFYLDMDDMEKAKELASDIENLSLRCNHDRMAAWLRLQRHYMNYYLDSERRAFTEAEKYCRLIERHMIKACEYQEWDSFLYCYAHTNMGKALQIYKNHWKEWEDERNPSSEYYTCKNIMRFFKKLGEVRKRKTVKLQMEPSFPLYQENGQYEILSLYQYYYGRARKVAELFDARNGTDSYCHWLEKAAKEG